MLERIDSISNLGLFSDYTHVEGCAFADLTVVFGENGVGKTTIAALLDAMRCGDTPAMLRRSSLISSSAPTAMLSFGDNAYCFDGTVWDARPPDDTIDVYFSDFISRNVYSGESIESGHRRQLCEFALGPQALRDIAQLGEAGRLSSIALKEVQRHEDSLRRLVKLPHSLPQFESLAPDDGIDAKIKSADAILAAARRITEELAREIPGALPLPSLPSELISDFLAATTADVAVDAVAAVKSHVLSQLDVKEGEDWLAYGAQHAATECPFCGQSLAGVGLVEAIAAYFGDAYKRHVRSVREAADGIRLAVGSGVADSLGASFTKQVSIAAKWEAQFPFDSTALTDAVSEALRLWRDASALLGQVVAEKLAAPLDVIGPSRTDEAIAKYEDALAHLASVNVVLAKCEGAALSYKEALSKASTEDLQMELNSLQNTKLRHESYVVEMFDARQVALQERIEQEDRRKKLKEDIEAHATRIVGTYQDAINFYLASFGCEMRIDAVRAGFPSGLASVSYELKVRGQGVPLGYEVAAPCFQTALSEGDRTSLALAFFLARLREGDRLDARTVVLDDPVDSFGESRRRAVYFAIRDLIARGAQVVVLTHDERLAAMLWRESNKGPMKNRSFSAVEVIETTAGGATLRPWDVETATRGQYVTDYLLLIDLLEDRVEHTAALRSIRPYLEQRLRYVFPGTTLSTRDNLGDMVGKIKNASKHSPLKSLEPKIVELEELNNASLPSHHGSDDVAALPLPGRNDAKRYAKMALRVC